MRPQAEPEIPLSATKRALLTLKTMQARIDALEQARTEPIAIIGMGCRFPGGSSNPQAFWRLLRDGVDAIVEVPPDRWDVDAYYDPDPDAPGKMQNRHGGFIEHWDSFDAGFFRISPREAASLDPQQRVLLEVTWEALEHAGLSAEALLGSLTGVFVGISNFDHGISLVSELDRAQLDGHFATGSALSMAAGRMSYLFGFTGPSMVVDTACSSSLVAIHHAALSLRNRDCDLAVAGGVNILSMPQISICQSKGGMLSPDGRCKTFDATANGYTRSEGCGVIVLRRLSDALAQGDPILALIRGSAVNQDGASGGLTVPHGPSQERVIRRALEQGGVDPADIQYVEAHGTGTQLGDPIEIGALGNVFGRGRTAEQPLLAGSVKTNIGHLESAAGIAGLLKVVLAMQHGVIPPHLHFNTPNPLIPWQTLPVKVPTEPLPWDAEGGPRRAGVSSFGFSGTNAHIVLEQPPAPAASGPARPYQLLTLAAKTPSALETISANLAAHLKAHPEANMADVAYTAQVGRKAFQHRRMLVCRDREDAIGALEAGDPQRVLSGVAERAERPVVFMFPGVGDQHVGMALELYQGEPIFREAIDRCAEVLTPILGLDPRDVLYPHPTDDQRPTTNDGPPTTDHRPPTTDQRHLNDGRRTTDNQLLAQPKIDLRKLLGRDTERPDAAAQQLNQTALAHPILFMVEYALARLWMGWGVYPQALIGHSIGEYVAACLAGVFSLEDALYLVARRAQLIQALPAGAMLAALAPEEDLQPLLDDRLSLAAVNAPYSCVVAGEPEAVAALEQQLLASGVACQRVQSQHAFHSTMMAPIEEPLRALLSQVALHPPEIPLISNVSGAWLTEAEATDPEYWLRHTRRTVRFADGIGSLAGEPRWTLLEVGAGQTLCSLAWKYAEHHRITGWQIVASLRHLYDQQPNLPHLLEALGKLWLAGVEVDWRGFYADQQRQRIPLPTYPFERTRHRMDQSRSGVPVKRERAATVSIGPERETSSNGMSQPDHDTAREQLFAALRTILADALHIGPERVAAQVPFLELGADSIILLEVTRKIEKTFGVTLTIRQLFETLLTLDALGAYVAQHVSPDWYAAQVVAQSPAVAIEPPVPAPNGAIMPALPVEPPAPTPNGAAMPPGMAMAAVADTGVERLLREQIQAMSKMMSEQIALLGSARLEQPPVRAAGQPPKQTAAAQPRPPSSQASGAVTIGQSTSELAHAKQLAPAQQRYLDTFIARYTQRTAKSKQFAQTYRPVWADFRLTTGFRQELKELCYPIVAERSGGSHMWDIDGNAYLDVAMGFGVHLLGYNPPFITAALEEQIQQGIHLGPQANLVGEVSQLISELTGLERVTYCNSGTEAVMTAIRLARAATGRTRIVIFTDAYHGHSDHTLAVARMIDGVRQTIPWVPGVPQSVVGEVLVLTYGDAESLEVIGAHLHELAAVLVEPVQSRRPSLQPVEFLRQLRQMTAEADVPLIFDEVITGFRVHPGGAQAWFGIKADLATYGKVVGGGMPIGVIAGRSRYLDRVDGGQWNYGDDSFPLVAPSFAAGTFCKHPLALATARAILLRLKQEGPALQQQLNQRTDQMVQTLNTYFQNEGLSIQVSCFGSIFRFTQGSNFSYYYQPLEMDLLFYHLIDHGIYLWEGRTCFLSTAHSDADVDTLICAVQKSIGELRSGGFLPDSTPRSSNGSPKPSTRVESSNGVVAESAARANPYVVQTLPLTKAQQQLWALAQVGDDGILCSKVSGALELRGSLDPDVLRRAMQLVVDRHEALRSTLDDHGDLLRIWSSRDIAMPLVDLSALEASERQARLAAWFGEESRRSFDLAAGPLFRTTLIRLEPHLHLLAWETHHIVADGWSVAIIVRELGRLYTELSGGAAARLASPPQFREYVAWREQQMQTRAMARSQAYWLEQFAEALPPLNLLIDRPRPPIMTYSGGRLLQRFEAELGRAVKQAAQDYGATTFMLFLAVYNTLLHQFSGQNDLIVGIPISGRSLERAGDVVGYCSNMVAIRSRLADDATFLGYLKVVRGVLLDAYEHQDYPFAELIDQLNLRRDPGAAPLVAASFNMEPRISVQDVFELDVDIVAPLISFTPYELNLNVVEIGDEFILTFDYNSDLFEKTTGAQLLSYFEALLWAFIADPHQPVGEAYRLVRARADHEAQEAAREQFKKFRQQRFQRRAGNAPQA